MTPADGALAYAIIASIAIAIAAAPIIQRLRG